MARIVWCVEHSNTAIYNAAYYRSHCGSIPYERSSHWLEFFGRVADEIVRAFGPEAVFDAGCAYGMLVESLWDRGVTAGGRDVSEYAIGQSRPDIRPWLECGSLLEPIERRYDVITCIEVLEHLVPGDAVSAIANICAATDVVLFSSSPSDFSEPTHVNVRPPIAWISGFAAHDFGPDFELDPTFLAPHAMIFRRGNPSDRTAQRCYAELTRWRTLAAERLEAIARERHEVLLAHAGVERLEHDLFRLQTVETQLNEILQVHYSCAPSLLAAQETIAHLETSVRELHGRIDGLQRSLARMNDVMREIVSRETERAESERRALEAHGAEILASPILRSGKRRLDLAE
jgi:hypothetical protein